MVNEKIQKLNPAKSPGPDGWHPITLKNVADLITEPRGPSQNTLIKIMIL